MARGLASLSITTLGMMPPRDPSAIGHPNGTPICAWQPLHSSYLCRVGRAARAPWQHHCVPQRPHEPSGDAEVAQCHGFTHTAMGVAGLWSHCP